MAFDDLLKKLDELDKLTDGRRSYSYIMDRVDEIMPSGLYPFKINEKKDSIMLKSYESGIKFDINQHGRALRMGSPGIAGDFLKHARGVYASFYESILQQAPEKLANYTGVARQLYGLL